MHPLDWITHITGKLSPAAIEERAHRQSAERASSALPSPFANFRESLTAPALTMMKGIDDLPPVQR